MNYTGWELHNFDKANLYRLYQFNLIKDCIKGDVLEVGPGNCVYLKNYFEICKKIYLVEPTKKYFDKLKKIKKKHKNMFISKNLNIFKKKSFNTILYLDVLEHIKNDKLEIKKAFKLLKKGGTLVICVPAFQCLYSLYDKKIGHYRRYNKTEFKKMLKKCKIKTYEMRYFDFVGGLLIFISNFFFKNNLNNFQLKIKIWNLLVPISLIIDFILMKYFFGKSLLVKIKNT